MITIELLFQDFTTTRFVSRTWPWFASCPFLGGWNPQEEGGGAEAEEDTDKVSGRSSSAHRSDVPIDAKECPQCGDKFEDEGKGPEKCPSCGKEVAPGAKNCWNCGKELKK
jgi:hypothetical protein